LGFFVFFLSKVGGAELWLEPLWEGLGGWIKCTSLYGATGWKIPLTYIERVDERLRGFSISSM
jgi:hypothetical protein